MVTRKVRKILGRRCFFRSADRRAVDPQWHRFQFAKAAGLARMERAKPVIGQRSSLATTAEELLLRQPSRRSPAHSGGERIRGGLDSPNLLCTRPDVYIEG